MPGNFHDEHCGTILSLVLSLWGPINHMGTALCAVGLVRSKTFGTLFIPYNLFLFFRATFLLVLLNILPRTYSYSCHSAILEDDQHLTYYCLALIKKGILIVGDLYNTGVQIKSNSWIKFHPLGGTLLW